MLSFLQSLISADSYKIGLVGDSCYFCYNRKTYLEVNTITALYTACIFWNYVLKTRVGAQASAVYQIKAYWSPGPSEKEKRPNYENQDKLVTINTFHIFTRVYCNFIPETREAFFVEEQRKRLNTTVKMANANSPINPHPIHPPILYCNEFCFVVTSVQLYLKR